MVNDNVIYVLGDGNKIREKLEFHLLQGELEDVARISENLKRAIAKLSELAREEMDATIFVAGGDDLLFTVETDRYTLTHIEKLAKLFEDLTECTISFGIGINIEMAYINLKRAKTLRMSNIVAEGAFNE